MATTVTVGCKLPHGLVLQLQQGYQATIEGPQGSQRQVTKYTKAGKEVVIKGNAIPAGEAHDKTIVGGFALTYGVDAEFFAEWMLQHSEFPAVVNGLIFAHEKPQVAEGEAKNARDIVSGLEPINPAKLPDEFQKQVEKAS